jgi:hypothetical protein
MTTNDFEADRQLKVQRFHELAQRHTGLVIASQLAAKQASEQLTTETDRLTCPSERKRLLKKDRRAYPHGQR